MRVFAKAGELPLHVIETRSARKLEPACYLSAGVHGDEPAAAGGLIAWAETNVVLLRRASFLIFPCLNPHGLMRNERVDGRGYDLNRRFHLLDDEVCGAWHREVAGRTLLIGLCLHEDYDAEGAYIYELGDHRQPVSHAILRACGSALPIDLRRRIDGRATNRGVIRPRKIPADLPGMPEALVLHQLGCPVTLTFETPSEFDLDARVEMQRRFITAALKQTAGVA